MAKLDPRADPVTNPPAGAEDYKVDRVEISIKMPEPPKIAEPVVDAEAAPVSSAESRKSEPPRSAVTNSDPRYAALEKLLDVNDWRAVASELGALEDAGKLPPNLGLLAALAHNESSAAGHPDSVPTAIRCVAAIFGVPQESPIARVLARRILRKNPTRLRDRPAPPARVSFFIIAVTLVLSGGLGWFLSSGGVNMLMKLFR